MALPLIAARLRIRAQDPSLSLVLRGGRCFRDGRWQEGDVGIDSAGRLRFGPLLHADQIIDTSEHTVHTLRSFLLARFSPDRKGAPMHCRLPKTQLMRRVDANRVRHGAGRTSA